jgi:hypothetical protein
MNSITRLVAAVAGLVLLLNITTTWGQPVCVAPGCNPTASDANSNTAGGLDALVNVRSSPKSVADPVVMRSDGDGASWWLCGL